MENLENGINIYQQYEMELIENLKYGISIFQKMKWAFCIMGSMSFRNSELGTGTMGSTFSNHIQLIFEALNF